MTLGGRLYDAAEIGIALEPDWKFPAARATSPRHAIGARQAKAASWPHSSGPRLNGHEIDRSDLRSHPGGRPESRLWRGLERRRHSCRWPAHPVEMAQA